MRPWFMTATVSAMVMASSWSCVTWTKVMPTSVWMRLSSICIWRRSLRSSAPSGSSSSSTSGWLISARATATRCCWPPESWPGLRRAIGRELDELEHVLDLLLDVLDAATAQAEGDVLEDVEVREERVALEDRVDRALVRAQLRDVLVADEDRARGRVLEARDHAQRRRLAAARGPEQGEERAGRDGQVEVVDRRHGREALGQADQVQVLDLTGHDGGTGHRDRPFLLLRCWTRSWHGQCSRACRTDRPRDGGLPRPAARTISCR